MTARAADDAPGAVAPKLAPIKLDAVRARQLAKQMEAAGRPADAQAIQSVLAQRGRVTIHLPIEQALNAAITLHKAGGPPAKQAEVYYKAVLAAQPDHARARHLFGVLLHHLKRSKEAMKHIEKALEPLRDQAWMWNNVALIHREGGDLAKAEQYYLKALALKEDYPEAHNNLGVVCRWAERWEEAERRYKRAIELRPDYIEALVNLGHLQVKLGRISEGLDNISRAILLEPKSGKPRMVLALSHLRLGEIDKAKEIYREWIESDPDNPTPRHLLIACSGETPDRADDRYVAHSFDEFANTFDAKLARLGYVAPQLVADALAAAYPARASFGVVIDAGCGTGLCGPLIRDRSSRLIGVDLSSGMLAKAKERGGYDALHESELTGFLQTRKSACDAIISADTLCYFGALTDFAAAAYGALKPNGVLVFTVEAQPDDAPKEYRLHNHGRYIHRRDYVERSLTDAGFTIDTVRREHLRNEDGNPVFGWLVTARRR